MDIIRNPALSNGEAADPLAGSTDGQGPLPAAGQRRSAEALCEWAEALGRSTESVRQAAELVRLLAERVRADADRAHEAMEEARRLVAAARAAARAASAEQEWIADEVRRSEARLRHNARGTGDWGAGASGW
jgi:hypothetical protein